MTDVDGLVAFLRARLDQQRGLAEVMWRQRNSRRTADRLLAEVSAHRRIVDRHDGRYVEARGPDGEEREGWFCDRDDDEWPCADLRDLAAPHADHPGYLPEWRP